MLAISNHSEADENASIVYTLPVTEVSLGESPLKDLLSAWLVAGRKYLVYTGGRDGEFDVYKISSSGGKETRLTSAKALERWTRIHSRRQVHLLQLNTLRDDANLANETGRKWPGADHRRRIQ